MGKVITAFICIISTASIIFVLSLFNFWPLNVYPWVSMSGIAIGTFIISLFWMNYLTYKSKNEAKKLSLINEIKKEMEKLNKDCGFPKSLIFIFKGDEFRRKRGELIKRIELLNEYIKLKYIELNLTKLPSEDRSSLKIKITNILDKLTKELNSALCPQQFRKKKNELVGSLELLNRYIELTTTMSPSGDKIEEKDEKIQKGKLKGKNDENPKKEKKEETDKKIEIVSEEPVGVLDKHEIRRSLTISLTIVYFMLLFFTIFNPVITTTRDISITNTTHGNITGNISMGDASIRVTEANITLTNTTTHTSPNLENPFIEIFSYVYGAVIIFYFSSRAVETYLAKKK